MFSKWSWGKTLGFENSPSSPLCLELRWHSLDWSNYFHPGEQLQSLAWLGCLHLAGFTCQKNGCSDTISGWVHAASLSTSWIWVLRYLSQFPIRAKEREVRLKNKCRLCLFLDCTAVWMCSTNHVIPMKAPDLHVLRTGLGFRCEVFSCSVWYLPLTIQLSIKKFHTVRRCVCVRMCVRVWCLYSPVSRCRRQWLKIFLLDWENAQCRWRWPSTPCN